MRRLILALLILILGGSAGLVLAAVKKKPVPKKKAPLPLVLTSAALKDGAKIPVEYSCEGANVSPPLKISGIPRGTKSLALIMDDPDAVPVIGRVADHWVLWNIPVSATTIAKGSVPKGASQGLALDASNYQGPCPPAGETHRYFFKLFALKVPKLNLPPSTTGAELVKAMKGKIIKGAKLMGRFSASPAAAPVTERPTPATPAPASAPAQSAAPAPSAPSPSPAPTIDY